MDLSKLDKIIEELEKKSVRPGSLPVIVGGQRGIWRTVRGFRMFLEFPKGAKFPGKVLIGPPSFVGHPLNNVPSKAWEALTPRHTTKEFDGFSPSSNGIETLKQSIRNSIDPKDTRNSALNGLNTVLELVPISRSAGFSDDEIKQALKGTSPNKPPSSSTSDAPKPEESTKRPVSTIDLKPRGRTESPTSTPTKADIEHNVHELEGALALSPSKLKDQGKKSKEANMADFLEKVVAGKIKNDDILKRRVQDLANGLRSGKFSVVQVQDEVREIATNYAKVKDKQFKPAEREALQDSAELKEFIENFETNLESKISEGIDRAQGKFKPADKDNQQVSESRIKELVDENRQRSEELQRSSEKQRAEAQRLRDEAAAERKKAQEFMSAAQLERLNIDASIALLNELASKIQNTKVKRELKQAIETISKTSFSKRSILLRLYQLLQILLLLIPGL